MDFLHLGYRCELFTNSFAALATLSRLLSESASGFLKNRDAVIGLTPANLATSVSRISPDFARFRSMTRSYHNKTAN